MTNFINHNNDYSSREAIERYKLMKKNTQQRYAAWSREFYKDKLWKRAQEAEYRPAPQVGFGQSYSHSFTDTAEDEGSGLDYNA